MSEARVELGAGYEDASRVEPDVELVSEPGGAFVGIAPWGRVSRPVGERGTLALSGSASFDRFIDDSARRSVGAAGLAELTWRARSRRYGRLSLGAQLFDDSEIDTARRTGGGGRGAIGWSGLRAGFEAGLGAWRRRYPGLEVADASGVPGDYDETSVAVDAAVYGRVGRATVLRAEVSRRSTDARDPLFDAASWYARGDVRWSPAAAWTVRATAAYQHREFDDRPPGEESDAYAQLGVGLERELGERRSLAVQWAYARYGEPDGGDDDAHRLGVAVAWRFGRRTAAGSRSVTAEERTGEPDAWPVDGGVRFRLRRPGAAAVSVVGDFNGWDPDRHPLQPAGDGWWERTVALPAGSHQYAYVIDGETVAPPDPPAGIDDGFGGRNGLLVVTETAVTSDAR